MSRSGIIERRFNKVNTLPPYDVSDDIQIIHNRQTVVDLHADSLLWNRDLLMRSNYGHVDFQRLLAANVSIQVFGVVTSFPFGLNLGRLSLKVDLITLLSIFHHWPLRTRNNLFQRAIFQSQRLDEMVSRSDGRVMLIKSVTDLDRFLTLRNTRPGMIGSLLALEGAHALNGELSNLTKLYDASFRILGISHFFDNEAGGSAHGRQGYGLSAFGYELVKMSQEQRMIIDLSHASARVIDEVTNMVERPVMVSHTGVFGTCNNPRNLTDRQIKKIAELGGIIGITMVRRAVCGEQIEKIVAAIRYVSDLVGPDYVGVGSDFDGAITAPFDATGLPLLTKALLSQGFNEGQINQIMGSNALRMLRDALPND